jgi:hypothetical protein
MPALGGFITSLTTVASAAFALPILGVAVLMSGISFATGNREAGKSWAIGGLLGTGIVLAIPQIVASIPRPA